MSKKRKVAPKKRETHGEEFSMQELINELQEEANLKVARERVYKAIDSERDYQDSKWGDTLSGGRPGDGSRTVDEFVAYIVGYTNDLLHTASHFGSDEDKLQIVRKVAGLAVACMEQHGAPYRVGFEKKDR